VIGITNPYTDQVRDAADASHDDIVEQYGAAAQIALVETLTSERAAFRYGAQTQLASCAADLRSWAAAYRAAARATSHLGPDGDESSDAFEARIERALFVSKEFVVFASDWLSEMERTAQ
jgi:hypothetical protein